MILYGMNIQNQDGQDKGLESMGVKKESLQIILITLLKKILIVES
jgi:hypothetical protein